MMASSTGNGTPQRRLAVLASANQSPYSAKMLQASSTLRGGEVVQEAISRNP
jgi:hypothetical protein